ncbi:MAG: YajQ family cyclic di-GMP-binding protein [Betaproteobacteria bacterium TMED156]|nr:MAG: YajQ family cyclic di-GMP-binding protein [Betaproteobacteria bacterium TMED156]
MPSFDITVQVNKTEVRNSIDQASKEIQNRFDFKNTSAEIKFIDNEITCMADNDFQLSQLQDVFYSKCAKRKVDIRLFNHGDKTKISGNKVKQNITIMNGIKMEDAKKIVQKIKLMKIKVQSSIQGDLIRVSGSKKDLLQDVISLLKKEIKYLPLIFENFRD